MLRAVDEGVSRILTVGVDLASSRRALDLSRGYDGVFAAVGIHPSRADTQAEDFAQIRALATEGDVCAIGEIGLDYYRETVDRETQMKAFFAQIELAVALRLPVIVHDREAHDDILEMLIGSDVRGVLHCFSGDLALAARAVSGGFYISIAGNVTYKAAETLHAVAREVPLERLLLETDSPFLPPQPWRGQRNEPTHVTAVAEKVAEIRGMPVEEIAVTTSENAGRLFAWK